MKQIVDETYQSNDYLHPTIDDEFMDGERFGSGNNGAIGKLTL